MIWAHLSAWFSQKFAWSTDHSILLIENQYFLQSYLVFFPSLNKANTYRLCACRCHCRSQSIHNTHTQMNAVDGALRGLVVWKSGKTCGETAVYVVQWKSVLSYTLNVADVPNARWALYTWSVCSFVISLNKFCIFRYLRLWSLAWRPLDSRSNHGLFLTLVRQFFYVRMPLDTFSFPILAAPDKFVTHTPFSHDTFLV